MRFIAVFVLFLTSGMSLAASETPILGVEAGDIYEMMKEPVVSISPSVRRKSGIVVCHKEHHMYGETDYYCANLAVGRTIKSLDFVGDSAGVLYRNMPVPEVKITDLERKKTGRVVCTRSDYMLGETEFDCETYPLKK